MSETRHVEHTEHVTSEPLETVEKPAEEIVSGTVDAAEAAVALANASAAAAELDAAERVRKLEEGIAEWREQIGTSLAMTSEQLGSLALREDERHKRDAELNARLERLESHPSLTRPELEGNPGRASNPGPAETEPQRGQGAATLVGAEGAAQLGPAEVSGGGSVGATGVQVGAALEGARRKRRWI